MASHPRTSFFFLNKTYSSKDDFLVVTLFCPGQCLTCFLIYMVSGHLNAKNKRTLFCNNFGEFFLLRNKLSTSTDY